MEPERRRRRPAVSCILCRKRKIRCDRQLPCRNCTKSRNATCFYKDDPRVPRKQGESLETSQTLGGSDVARLSPSIETRSDSAVDSGQRRAETTTAANSARSRPAQPGNHVELTKRTVPEQSASAGTSSANTPALTFTRRSRVETRTINFAGNFYVHDEHRLNNESQPVTRSCSDIIDVIEGYLRDENKSKMLQIERRNKALGRIIKKRRAPPWPCPPTPDLPARVIADTLIECYLNTSESVFRVLHIPSFRRDYEAVWDPSHNPDPAFLVQLKLVLAVGSTTYDPEFSLRPYAIRWVYEGQTWLSAPEFKSRLGLTALQSSILLHLAREATGVGEDMVWATVGTTLRIAMYMGLHRDPAGLGPSTLTPLMAEMRRRLWNTVLELSLQSSLNAGGPPLINLDQFDTEPPGNFDDDQLTGQNSEVPPIAKPDHQFTQTTLAITLRTLFPQRLAIVKYLNDISSGGDYHETLRLDAELRDGYKQFTRTLHACKIPVEGQSNLGLRIADLILRRYFLVLHLPYFAPAMQETSFAFSRRVVVESAVRLWRAVFPRPLLHLSDDDTAGAEWDPLQLIITNGSGFLLAVGVQVYVSIALELINLLREEESFCLGPVELRPDLLAMLDDFRAWLWRRLEAGMTNTKGYLVACMIYAQVDAMRRQMTEDERIAHIVRAAEEAEERCLELLEQIEASSRPLQEAVGVGVDGVGGGSGIDLSPDFGMENWDYMVSVTNPSLDTEHIANRKRSATTQQNHEESIISVTPIFPPGENVVFAHSSFFSRFTPAGTYPELPSPARVREEAARLGIAAAAEAAEGGDGGGKSARAKLVPFHALGLLVKYGTEITRMSPAEGKAMMLVRRMLTLASSSSGVPVPVPEIFGWRRDAEVGERFVYMDLPEGEVLEDRWAGLSEVEREGVCTQLRDVVAEWRRLRLGGVGFVGSVDNGPLQDEVFRRCTIAGTPPAGPFPTVAAFHDYFVSMAVTVSQSRYAGAGDGQVRYTPHHLFPEHVPVVFTHGGLHPRNIIVSAGPRPRVVSILGWEQAGWYPAYWELCKARFECSRRGRLGGWESKYLPWILDSQGLDTTMQGWNSGALTQYWDYFVGLM
ncbi:fungal-specific transcription factor domain-containing protein [Corynascus similis CBS 632.67]